MKSVVVLIARPPLRCYQRFIDPSGLSAWVPNLRRVRLVASDSAGRPTEISFEFAQSLMYSLGYSYDDDARVVTFEPRAGRRDAVSGSARFEDDGDGGTKLTYELKQGSGRSVTELALGDPQRLVDAFAQWMTTSTR